VEGVYRWGHGITGRGWSKTFDFGFSVEGWGGGGNAMPLYI